MLKAFVTLGSVCALGAVILAHDPTTKVTWSREIVRIVTARCAGCHTASGPAPMPLATYQEARPWAHAIKQQVVSRRMPKWAAARGFGQFADDPSLSPFEIALISAWADGGAPKGVDADLPSTAATSSAARPTPRPSISLTLPGRQSAPSGERRTMSVTTRVAADRWLTAWQFSPSDPAIIQAEFAIKGGTYLGNWVPPSQKTSLPAGTGRRIPAGSSIDVTVWYRSTRLQEDFPVGLPGRPPILDLFVTDRRPSRELHTATLPCGDGALPASSEIVAVRPMDAATGSDLGIALYPAAGPPRAIAWVREIDPGYLATYRLSRPLTVPARSRIEVSSSAPSCHATVDYLTK